MCAFADKKDEAKSHSDDEGTSQSSVQLSEGKDAHHAVAAAQTSTGSADAAEFDFLFQYL